jgi:hypothetical protein
MLRAARPSEARTRPPVGAGHMYAWPPRAAPGGTRQPTGAGGGPERGRTSQPTSGGASADVGDRQRRASRKARASAGRAAKTPKNTRQCRVERTRIFSAPSGNRSARVLDSWPASTPAGVRASNAGGHGDGPHREAAGRRCAVSRSAGDLAGALSAHGGGQAENRRDPQRLRACPAPGRRPPRGAWRRCRRDAMPAQIGQLAEIGR